MYDDLLYKALIYCAKCFTEKERLEVRDSIEISDVYRRGITLEYFDQFIDDYSIRYNDNYYIYCREVPLNITHEYFNYCHKDDFILLVDSLKKLHIII